MKRLLSTIAAMLFLASCTQLYQPTGSGEIPDTTAVERQLRHDVSALAEDIGELNHYHQDAYERARDYIKGEFEAAGYTVDDQRFTIPAQRRFEGAAGKTATLFTRKGMPVRACNNSRLRHRVSYTPVPTVPSPAKPICNARSLMRGRHCTPSPLPFQAYC